MDGLRGLVRHTAVNEVGTHANVLAHQLKIRPRVKR